MAALNWATDDDIFHCVMRIQYSIPSDARYQVTSLCSLHLALALHFLLELAFLATGTPRLEPQGATSGSARSEFDFRSEGPNASRLSLMLICLRSNLG